jgi:hypothetical protein
MKAFLTCTIIIFFILTGSGHLFSQLSNKKIIEFGWNYPDVSQLKAGLNQMQKLPFDGVVFSFQRKITDIFDTIPLADKYFEFPTLQILPWTTFTDNFILLWGMSKTGGHWLSDSAWNVIIENTKKVSKAAKLSKAKGVLFDPEYYYEDPNADPWKYKPELYGGLSYQQVYKVVKKRGTQFIQALESNKPDITVLSTWLFGLIIEQLKHKPLEEIGQALYLPFIEGMLAGQGKYSTIIDGNESAYWYKKAEDFFESGKMLRNKGQRLIPQTKVDNIKVAQCVYYDGIYDLLPQSKRNSTLKEKEQWFTNNLYNALAATDKYVWVYGEKINWWKPMEDSSVVKLLEGIKKQYHEFSKQKEK